MPLSESRHWKAGWIHAFERKQALESGLNPCFQAGPAEDSF